jgi:long-subunit acyl-CoA synthetase (AMP-forming)
MNDKSLILKVNFSGEIVPLEEDGELHIRGPHVINRYWNDPEKTNAAIDSNGWYLT